LAAGSSAPSATLQRGPSMTVSDARRERAAARPTCRRDFPRSTGGLTMTACATGQPLWTAGDGCPNLRARTIAGIDGRGWWARQHTAQRGRVATGTPRPPSRSGHERPGAATLRAGALPSVRALTGSARVRRGVDAAPTSRRWRPSLKDPVRAPAGGAKRPGLLAPPLRLGKRVRSWRVQPAVSQQGHRGVAGAPSSQAGDGEMCGAGRCRRADRLHPTSPAPSRPPQRVAARRSQHCSACRGGSAGRTLFGR